MTLLQSVASLKKQLLAVYNDSILAEQYAWWILEEITQKKQAHLLTQESLLLSAAQQSMLASWLDKIVHEHMPLQYLIGKVPFNDLQIFVEPPILIPRPETEEWAIDIASQLKELSNQKITVLDLCSGTGCIALTLAHHVPDAMVYACDINPQAVALGKKNAAHNNVSNVLFLQSDLFQAVKDKKFDLIVANPPYISSSTWQQLDASVKKWEDPRALVADHDGLALLESIIEQAPFYIKNNQDLAKQGMPQLMLEIGFDQADAVTAFMQAQGYVDVRAHKDLEGKDRVVGGRVRYVANNSQED